MRTTLPNSERKQEGMAGLAKGLAIIEAFAARQSISVAEAARAADISRASARRCLLTLSELGYLERRDFEFRATPRLQRLGGFNRREHLLQLTQPMLIEARDRLNESVSLAVLEAHASYFIAREEAEHIVTAGVKLGARLPVYCSASGRLLLSDFSDEDVLERLSREPLTARTGRTITDVPALLSEVRNCRLRNYCICDEELELGLRSLAVPIREPEGGQILAALCVSVASARVMAEELAKDFLPELQRCATLVEQAWPR